MDLSVGFEVPEAVRWRVALRVVVRVALRVAARSARHVVIAAGTVGRGVVRFVTSLCRRSLRERWGVRWLAAGAALARSPLVSVLTGFASGLVAVLLVRAGSR